MQEGIFRVAPNASERAQTKAALDRHGSMTEQDAADISVHTAASLIKALMADLPSQLLANVPARLFDEASAQRVGNDLLEQVFAHLSAVEANTLVRRLGGLRLHWWST